ncbi:MAG: hypothetical protein IJX69_03585 [Oscillospiraceae bacterium]|nr:hypothetical protein [Oscillospiraceae bacterium]
MAQPGKYGREAIWTAGVIFAATGAVVSLAAVILWICQPGFDGFPAFAILGPVFLILGSAFLVSDRKKRRIAAELKENGRSVWGEIVAVERNTTLRVNGSYAWFARVRYFDGLGNVYIFESRCYATRKTPDLVGRHVKVYVDKDYQRSHVDLERVK